MNDIRRLEALLSGEPGDGLAMHLYRPHETIDPAPRLKLYRHGEPLTLSDVLPLLENMGTKVIDERPYEIRPARADPVWIYDFGLHREALADLDVAEVRERFQETLAAVWRGEIENDRFNWLVLRAGLRGRDVTVLRAYVKYLGQVGTTFSRDLHRRDDRGQPGRRKPGSSSCSPSDSIPTSTATPTAVSSPSRRSLTSRAASTWSRA